MRDVTHLLFAVSHFLSRFLFLFSQNGQHAEHIILKYTHLDRVIVADLFLNSRLLADDHFLSYQNANGSRTVRRFSKSDADLCHYHVCEISLISKKLERPTNSFCFD